jgi:hypothetical protein
MTPTARFVVPARRDLISRKDAPPTKSQDRQISEPCSGGLSRSRSLRTDSGNSVGKLRSPSISVFGKLHRPRPEEGVALGVGVVPALDRLAQGLLAVVLGAPVGREGRRL